MNSNCSKWRATGPRQGSQVQVVITQEPPSKHWKCDWLQTDLFGLTAALCDLDLVTVVCTHGNVKLLRIKEPRRFGNKRWTCRGQKNKKKDHKFSHRPRFSASGSACSHKNPTQSHPYLMVQELIKTHFQRTLGNIEESSCGVKDGREGEAKFCLWFDKLK